ncbi:MAG: tRNA (cytidine(34)-2'-O)-methyltransferase [Dehalococcoidia bacterium]|tara:strand:- start:269 stop:739 length:471 start_codon:yes stop_codon:yes gene_type:complete
MNNSLNLVLYNPEIPQNTGNIIRLCHNTGSTLHLIKPLGFNFQDNKLRRAHMDYNEGNKPIIHDSFEHFIESEKPNKLYAVDTFGEQNYSDIQYIGNEYFIFGSESSGLPKDVFFDKSITKRIKIPMMEDSRSINLSNSVSIVLYESLRQINFKNF